VLIWRWLCLGVYLALALPWGQPGSALVLIWLCLGAKLTPPGAYLALSWCIFGFGSALVYILALALPWCSFGSASMLFWLCLGVGSAFALVFIQQSQISL
jgi:hypothetical protein